MTAAAAPDLNENIRQVHAEGKGVFMMEAVRCTDLPFLVVDALMGDADVIRLLNQVNDTVRRIQSAPRKAPDIRW